MASARSSLALSTSILVATALVALSSLSPVTAVAMLIMLLGACGILIFRPTLAQFGVFLIVLYCLFISWDEASLGGVKPRLLLLFFGTAALVVGGAVRKAPRIPWWLHAYGLAAVAASLLQVYFPITQAYLDSRYATSPQGQALGSREPMIAGLLSLLENNYLVPMAVVLACVVQPKALRWTITAFVAGVSISAFVGFLGYEGWETLAGLFAPPPAVGFRAQGWASHSLHLATAIVFALPLSVWVALQPSPRLRWVGRACLVALLLGLYASGSRGGNVAGPVALGLCAFFMPSVRSRLHIIGTVLAGAFAAIALWVPGALGGFLAATRLSGGSTASASDLGRGQVLDQSTLDIQHSPIFGIGVQFLAEAHVLYYGVVASGGVVLFVGWLLFNVGSIQAASRCLKFDRSLGGAVLATLLASLAYWTVADDFQVATVEIIYGFVIAILALDRLKVGEGAEEPIDEPATAPAPDPVAA